MSDQDNTLRDAVRHAAAEKNGKCRKDLIELVRRVPGNDVRYFLGEEETDYWSAMQKVASEDSYMADFLCGGSGQIKEIHFNRIPEGN